MKKLTLLVLLFANVHAMCQSVADAARASKEKKQGTAKKVITDEDMPSSAAGGAAAVSDEEAGWNADLERMRRAYQQVCSTPGKVSPEQKKFLEEESRPLKDRVETESKEADKLKAELTQLRKDEQSEVDTAGGDQMKIAQIHQRYAAQVKPIQAKASASMQRVMLVLKESFGAIGDCMKKAQ